MWKPIAISAIIILLSYIVPRDEVKSIAFYFVLVPIFAIFRFDARIPIVYALLLMLLAAILASISATFPANQIVMLSFWLLIVGIGCLLIELLRTKEVKEVNSVHRTDPIIGSSVPVPERL